MNVLPKKSDYARLALVLVRLYCSVLFLAFSAGWYSCSAVTVQVTSTPVASFAAPSESPFGVSGADWKNPRSIARVAALGVRQALIDLAWEDFADSKHMASERRLQAFLDEAHGAGIRIWIAMPPLTSDNTDRAYHAMLARLTVWRDRIVGLSIGPIDSATVVASSQLHAAVAKATPGLPLVAELADFDAALMTTLLSATDGTPWVALAIPLRGDRVRDLAQLDEAIRTSSIPVWSWRVAGPIVGVDKRLTDGENMRQAVCRPVQALAHGAQKVFWAALADAETGSALCAYNGQKMKPSFRSFEVMGARLWPFEKVSTVKEGPDVWAYRFEQPANQVTTVVWTGWDAPRQKWTKPESEKLFLGDLGGSLVAKPDDQLLSPDPLYYIENLTAPFKKPPSHGKNIAHDERPRTYTRCAFPASSATSVPEVKVTEGWDWSLPESVKVTAGSGFFQFGKLPEDDIRIIGWHPEWKEWHVGPGRFDFKTLDDKLKLAREQNFSVGLRLQSVVKSPVPQWVIRKYQPAQSQIPNPRKLQIVAPWDADVRREFEALAAEFGRRGYPADPHLALFSIHGISESTGEEFDLTSRAIKHLEQTAGLNPDNLRAWVFGRINGGCPDRACRLD